ASGLTRRGAQAGNQLPAPFDERFQSLPARRGDSPRAPDLAAYLIEMRDRAVQTASRLRRRGSIGLLDERARPPHPECDRPPEIQPERRVAADVRLGQLRQHAVDPGEPVDEVSTGSPGVAPVFGAAVAVVRASDSGRGREAARAAAGSAVTDLARGVGRRLDHAIATERLVCADVTPSALRARYSALVGRGAGTVGAAGRRRAAGVDRRAPGEERMVRRGTAVGRRRSEPRILPDQVAGRVSPEPAAGEVTEEVVTRGGEGSGAFGARRGGVAGEDRVAEGHRAALLGDATGLTRRRVEYDSDVVQGHRPAR